MRFGAKYHYISQRNEKGTLGAVRYRARKQQLSDEYDNLTAAQKQLVIDDARRAQRQKLVEAAAAMQQVPQVGDGDVGGDARSRVLKHVRPLWGLQDGEFPISEEAWRSFLSSLAHGAQDAPHAASHAGGQDLVRRVGGAGEVNLVACQCGAC